MDDYFTGGSICRTNEMIQLLLLLPSPQAVHGRSFSNFIYIESLVVEPQTLHNIPFVTSNIPYLINSLNANLYRLNKGKRRFRIHYPNSKC